MKPNRIAVEMIVVLLFSTTALAEPTKTLQIARYTDTSLEPSRETVNPLDVVISVSLPQKMNKVGDAINFILQRSGYRVISADRNKASEMYVLFELPIPSSHRNIGPLRLKTALEVLAGGSFDLCINDVTREVWFEIKTEDKAALETVDVTAAKKRWMDKVAVHRALSLNVTREYQPINDRVLEPTEDLRQHYGPVKEGETLNKIANKFLTGDLNRSQLLASIFYANEAAFIGDNMNLLRAGSTLVIPSRSETTAYSIAEAQNLEDHQYQLFLRGNPS